MSVPIFKATDQGVVRQLLRRLRLFGGTSGRAHASLDAPQGFGFLTSRTGSYVCANLYYDGVSWNLHDTTQPGALLAVATSGAISLYTATAGVNPRTLVGPSSLASGHDSGWVALGNYGANWSNYGAGYDAQYRKLPNGLVMLRGLVTKSVALVASDIIATLPAGYRPAAAGAGARIIPQPANSSNVNMDVRIFNSGAIVVSVGGGWPGGAGSWISLDYIFLAEN